MKLVIQFYASVSEGTTNSLLSWINEQVFSAHNNGETIDEIIIQIASYGGSADRGILVYNTLRQIGIPIKTIGMSNVDSAAISIFCAGDKRLAMRSCRFLIHESRFPMAVDLDDAKLAEISKMNKIINTESARIVAKTCKGKIKIQGIRQNMRKSAVWDAEEAKKKNLVLDFADGEILYDIKNETVRLTFITDPPPATDGSQAKR